MVHLNKQLALSVLLLHGIIFIPCEAHTTSTEVITSTRMSSYRSVIMRRFSREQKNGKNPFHHKRTPAISSDIIMIDGDRLQVNNSLFTPNEVLLLKVIDTSNSILIEKYLTASNAPTWIQIPSHGQDKLQIMLETAEYIYIGNISI